MKFLVAAIFGPCHGGPLWISTVVLRLQDFFFVMMGPGSCRNLLSIVRSIVETILLTVNNKVQHSAAGAADSEVQHSAAGAAGSEASQATVSEATKGCRRQGEPGSGG